MSDLDLSVQHLRKSIKLLKGYDEFFDVMVDLIILEKKLKEMI